MTKFWMKALEAAGWTFAQVFLVTFAASFEALGSMEWGAIAPILTSAVLAAAGAALSLVKSIVVRNLGETDSTLISG